MTRLSLGSVTERETGLCNPNPWAAVFFLGDSIWRFETNAMSEPGEKDPKRTCKARTKDGQPCWGRRHPSGYCVAHDPALNQKREAGRVNGGRNSSRVARLEKLMPRRLRPVYDRLETALKDVHEGRLDIGRAKAMASLAGAMVRVLQAGELEELTRKIRELQGE